MDNVYVQWFPGHMTKTRRQMEKRLSQIDAVAEILDARIPLSSRNPDLDELVKDKPRLILLNKADLADEAQSERWVQYFRQQGCSAIKVSCQNHVGIQEFQARVKEVLAEKLAAYREKGMVGRSIKVMVAGIPNVGKSTFINRLAGGARLKTADRPGVTRGEQWINLGNGIELLDTPGVLWPKFDDPRVGEMLAFTGAVRDAVVDVEHLAVRLLELLLAQYPSLVAQRYEVSLEYDAFVFEVLERIARKRGFLQKGGVPNTERAAVMLLDEFRGGKLGRITLEQAPVQE